MRAICKVCKDKDSCSYLKRSRESDCIDVQTSDYGYEEAVEKAVEWLKENARNYIFRNKGRDGSGEGIWNYDYVFIDAKLFDDFKKAMEV